MELEKHGFDKHQVSSVYGAKKSRNQVFIENHWK